jgi:hypothetical protein
VTARRTFAAVDARPRIERLQGDLNAALREIQRNGNDQVVRSEWERSDELLDRMRGVRTDATSGRAVPDELLGLAHQLQVQMSRVEELMGPDARNADSISRLGDLAYAFHHEMHDGRLSYAEAQDRVETASRALERAEADVRRTGARGDLQSQWRDVHATVERMRSLMGV